MENDFRKKMKQIIGENLDEFETGAADRDEKDAETARELFEQFCASLPAEEAAQPKKKKKAPLFIPIAAAVLVGIFIGSFLFSDAPAARAFKTNVEQFFTSIFSPDTKIEEDGQQIDEYQSIEDLQKDLDFTLPQFTWLPEGYELSSVQKTKIDNNLTLISIDYLNSEADPLGFISISIQQLTSSESSISPFGGNSEYETKIINGMQVAFSSKEPNIAFLIYHDAYKIIISTQVDPEALEKIVANIQ